MKQKAKQPIPQGKYKPAVRHADLIYTSGMTPRQSGKLLYSGKIRASDPVDSYRDAVRLATTNALNAAQALLKDGESISGILQLQVFLNTDTDFTAHAKMADYASELFMEELGSGSMGSRAAIGVASLPSNAPVEISLIAKTNDKIF